MKYYTPPTNLTHNQEGGEIMDKHKDIPEFITQKFPYITDDEYYGHGYFSDLAKNVLKTKYYKEGEGLYELWNRVAYEISRVEHKNDRDEWYEKFMSILYGWYFVPGGRILYSVGRENVAPVNCFVIPIKEDSIPGIYKAIYESAITYVYQGGVGTDLTILRPEGAPLRSRDGHSPGILPFMELFSTNTMSISQNGRRGALMLTIRVEHPDVEKFIEAKTDPLGKLLAELSRENPDLANKYRVLVDHQRAVAGANISVILSKEFMEAVEKDLDWELYFPDYEKDPYLYDKEWDGDIRGWKEKGYPIKVYKVVKARDLWNKIIKHAHASAEPGIIFEGNILKDWVIEDKFLTTNPCSEIDLSAYEPCVLGHIVLNRYVKNLPYSVNHKDRMWKKSVDDIVYDIDDIQTFVNENINVDLLKRNVRIAVRFLDDVVEYAISRVPLKEQSEALKKYRRIGMGITGLAELFVMLNIPYDSPAAIKVADKIMEIISTEAFYTSAKLAEEKGGRVFKVPKDENAVFNRVAKIVQDKYNVNPIYRRNAFLLTVAPVGSGGIITETMGGIEPIFMPYYTRRVRLGETSDFTEVVVVQPIFEYIYGKKFESIDEAKDFFEHKLPEKLRRYALNIDPFFRVKMQATIQKWVDNSISSTVNLPEDVSVEYVRLIYEEAYRQGLKGITVYRENSRGNILESISNDEKSKDKISDKQDEKSNFILFIDKDGNERETSVRNKDENLLEHAEVCPVCKKKALVNSNGCYTCYECGYSKCSV